MKHFRFRRIFKCTQTLKTLMSSSSLQICFIFETSRTFRLCWMQILLQVIRWNLISFVHQSSLIWLFVVGGRLQDFVHLWPLSLQPVIGLKTRGRRAVARAGPTQPFHRGVLIQMSAHTSTTTKRAGFTFNPPTC